MSNSDDFSSGFLTCFVMVCVIGMVLVVLTAYAEAIYKIAKSKRNKRKG